MRIISLLILLSLFSCTERKSDKEKRLSEIEGNWLLVYPDHSGIGADQQTVYGEIQDSVVELMGLKLISFEKDGMFRQMDSVKTAGEWQLTPDMKLWIMHAGKGFTNFRADLLSFEDSVMELKEYLNYKGHHIPLVWNLKKISGREEDELFEPEANQWRKKPATPETDEQLRTKLADMLSYYAVYFFLVDAESSYFSSTRISMPFKFYQHAIGLRPLEKHPEFQSFFYDSAQAVKAHNYLERAINRTSRKFPRSEESFVYEYAAYMKMLAEEMKKLDK